MKFFGLFISRTDWKDLFEQMQRADKAEISEKDSFISTLRRDLAYFQRERKTDKKEPDPPLMVEANPDTRFSLGYFVTKPYMREITIFGQTFPCRGAERIQFWARPVTNGTGDLISTMVEAVSMDMILFPTPKEVFTPNLRIKVEWK